MHPGTAHTAAATMVGGLLGLVLSEVNEEGVETVDTVEVTELSSVGELMLPVLVMFWCFPGGCPQFIHFFFSDPPS